MEYNEELIAVIEEYVWHINNANGRDFLDQETDRLAEKYNYTKEKIINDLDTTFLIHCDDLYELA